MTDRVTTPFNATSTAEEVSAGVDLTGQRAIVTGGASGIGAETSLTLARHGASVTLAVRDVEIGHRTAGRIINETGNPHVDVRALELTNPSSVRRFIEHWDEPLHLLVNNAGVMAIQDRTVDAAGWETQFSTNFLGHFRLTVGLRSWLSRADGARVVAVSSSGHLYSPVVFDDINFRFRPYDPLLAYAQSKTAVILFGVAASTRWADDRISVNTLNPGAIATPLQRHVGGRLSTPLELQKTVAQGAATTLLLATSPLLNGVAGRYFNDNQEAVPTDHRPAGIGDLVNSVADYALDATTAEKLWTLATKAIRE